MYTYLPLLLFSLKVPGDDEDGEGALCLGIAWVSS